MAWIVKLIKKPKINNFKAGYFPRKFALKRDALELAHEVKNKGGQALVEKDKKVNG
jgi:hypothetical protein